MAKFYPRIQTVMIFIVCAVAVGGLTAYISSKNVPSLANNPAQANVSDAISGPLASSWQKQFLSDDSSVKLNANKTKTQTDTKPLSLTEQVGRNFFTHYAQLRQNNLADDDQLIRDTANQTIDEAVKAAKLPKTYLLKDIKVISQYDSSVIRSYGDAVAGIIVVDGPKGNALEIAGNAFENNDLSSLAKIQPITAAYRTIVKKLLAMPAPRILAQDQVDLINGFALLGFMAESLQNTDKDPAQTVVALDEHTSAEKLATEALAHMKNYFAKNKISFGSDQPGRILFSADLTLQ